MRNLYAIIEQPVKHGVRKKGRDYICSSNYKANMELRIRELRKEKQLSVEALARACGMSKSYLSEIERGVKQINGRLLEIIARELHVSPLDLMDDKSLGPDLLEHMRLMRSLSPADKQAVIRHAIGLAPKDNDEDAR